MATNTYSGLTDVQVAERVARGETNNFQVRVGRSYWEIFRDNVFTVFNMILFILLLILLRFGDTFSVVFASFSVVLNSIIGVAQEINAKLALEKLAAMSVQEVSVFRGGKVVKLPITQLVKDDVMPVEPGDRIAVDGRVLEADALEMDESLLTGESDAIHKEVDHNLSSGSFVIAGSGVMVATEVGANSTINRLSQTAKAYKHVLTPTQQEIARIVELSILGMALFGPMTVIAGLANHLPAVEIARNAVVLVTSFVPQGLVLTVTVSLVLGALVISRRQTLVQRTNAVESLANVNVLCFDKTGTLTRNKLAVTEVLPLNGMGIDQIRDKLHTYTVNLAHQNKTAGAIALYTQGLGPKIPSKLHEVPFTSARKWGAIVLPDETLYLGAPERVLDVSRDATPVGQSQALAQQGLRVLALARSAQPPQDGKLDPAREPMALVVMSDQVRDEIAHTLNEFRQVGVSLKVISGDNAETVGAIANAAGMPVTRAYTGDQVEAMSSAELDVAVREANLFARIEPETKRKIIRALKQQGNYVAMVGDGVNDVPALKEANMAIAMNDGAQIAKDVADVVLLNNAMSTLPLAFYEGQIITQKILATARLFLTKNFYTILAFIFVGFMTLPFPTNPIQISWLTFGAVNIPALLITFSLIKPMPMRSFAKDVLPYITAAIMVGALVASGLYALLYFMPLFGLDPNSITQAMEFAARDAARAGLLIFMQLYGTVVFWHTHGIDLLNPATLLKRWRITLLALVILALSMASPWIARDVFNTDLFTWVNPTPQTVLVVIVAFVIAVVALNLGLRNNRLMRIVDLSEK